MKYLLDTGILLRLVHATDPQHQSVVDSLTSLKSDGNTFYCGMQNIAEFWNVTTRPATARGGFGLSPQEAAAKLLVIRTGGRAPHRFPLKLRPVEAAGCDPRDLWSSGA